MGQCPAKVLAHEHEVARVGYQHKTIAAPIATHLRAVRSQPGVTLGGLHLDYAAFRRLPLLGAALLELIR